MNTKIQVLIFFILLAFISMNATAQLTKAEKKNIKTERKANHNKIEITLKAYTVCNIPGKMQIARVDRMQKKKVFFAERYTAKNAKSKVIAKKINAKGDKDHRILLGKNGKVYESVSRSDGYRVMINFDKPDYFANIRIDKSIPQFYIEDKDVVIRWLKFSNERLFKAESETPQKNNINGFETYSINRTDIDLNEVGITVFFDDKNQIITTLYLLTQRPKHRIYSRLDGWKKSRTHLLQSYTKCIKNNLANINND